jgi:hypothetical protein
MAGMGKKLKNLSLPRGGFWRVPVFVALFAGAGGGCGDSGGDLVCFEECKAESTVPCPGAPSETECITKCEGVRARRAKCLTEDAAFRLCFASAQLTCSSGARTTGDCSAEASQLTACLTANGET